MTLIWILFRIDPVKIWIVLLIIHLVIGVLQRPLQFASQALPVESSEHSHTHEVSFTDILKLISTGDVHHEHSHAEESSHNHPHHHSFQSGSTVLEFYASSFQFSLPEMQIAWRGIFLVGPEDPYLSEILRPPIS